MKEQNENCAVCCHVVGAIHHLFADERIKWHMLDRISDIREQQGWTILAFCVMDDDAYFILEAENAAEAVNGIRQAAEYVLDRLCCSIRGRKSGGSKLFHISSEKLNSMDEIAGRCRQIHRLPLENGYVSSLRDYWWSSYNTYIRTYDWPMVDSRIVMLHFSADPEEAVRKLRHFHRKKLPDLSLS